MKTKTEKRPRRKTKTSPAKPKLTERRVISQPPDWWLAFDRLAKASGVSVSQLIGDAVANLLPAADRAQLSQRLGPGRRSTKGE